MFAIVQGALIRPAIKTLKETWTVVIGLVFAAFGFFRHGLYRYRRRALHLHDPGRTERPWSYPALNGLMSNRVADNAQGELQGGVNSVNSLTMIVGPLVATQLFTRFTANADAATYFPGVAFFGAGISIVVGAFIFFQASVRSRKHEQNRA